jgi:hypothetical protein
VQSSPLTFDHINVMPLTEQYFNYFGNTNDFLVNGLSAQPFGGSVNKTLQTTHPYQINRDYTALLRQPVKLTNAHPFFFYRDVAIVEPGKDFVGVEATKDGVNWTAIAPSYDATKNASWSSAFSAFQNGTEAMFVDHNINLTNKFSVGDTLLFRFRLKSDNTITGWGWSIDDLYIQQRPTSVIDTTEPTVSLYPNPSSGSFLVSVPINKEGDVDISVLDLSGRVMSRIQKRKEPIGMVKQELELGNAPSGIYLVKITTADGNWTKKIKIQQ